MSERKVTTDFNNPETHPLKLALCGPLGVGKDYVAEKGEYRIIGFADPLYAIIDTFHGSCGRDKSVPGVRETLQKIGQWGRGTVNAQYPITPERLAFCDLMRNNPVAQGLLRDYGVRPDEFGLSKDIWVNGLLMRSRKLFGKVAVTNVRFDNEAKALQKEGFFLAAVVCDEESLNFRQTGRVTTDAAKHDISEQFGWAAFRQYSAPDSAVEIPVDGYIWNADHRYVPYGSESHGGRPVFVLR